MVTKTDGRKLTRNEYWNRQPNLVWYHLWGEESDTPHPKGAGTQRPQNFRTRSGRPHGLSYSDRIRRVDDVRVSRVQPLALSYRDLVPACQKFPGALFIRAHGTRNGNQISHGNRTILEENFIGSATPPVLANYFWQEF